MRARRISCVVLYCAADACSFASAIMASSSACEQLACISRDTSAMPFSRPLSSVISARSKARMKTSYDMKPGVSSNALKSVMASYFVIPSE